MNHGGIDKDIKLILDLTKIYIRYVKKEEWFLEH